MRKIVKMVLCLCLMISFSLNVKAEGMYTEENGLEDWGINPKLRFEGNHVRSGFFYIIKDADTPEKSILYEAKQLRVYWGNAGLMKSYTLTNGQTLEYRKGDPAYADEQVIDIPRQKVVVDHDCVGFTVPMELDKYKVNKPVKAGTYEAERLVLGWVEVIQEDGSRVWISPNLDKNDEFHEGDYLTFENEIETLSAQSVNNIPIYTNYLVKNMNLKLRPGYSQVPLYVTIHNTGNPSSGADALVHARLQYNSQNNPTDYKSWHFQVDDHSIYQSIPMDEVAWHAGDGILMGNGATIGIEICENVDGNYAQAEKNAAYLTAQILYENNMPKDAIRMHYDWSAKNCPHNIREGTAGTMGWDAFKALVAKVYDQLVEENKQPEIEEIDEVFVDFLSKTELTYDQNLLMGIGLENNVSDLISSLQQIDETASFIMMNEKDEEVTGGIVGTGFKLKITFPETEEELKEHTFTIAIQSDINGDGKFNALDYRLFTYYMLDKNQYAFTDVQKAGADLNHKPNEKIAVNALDYRIMTYSMLE